MPVYSARPPLTPPRILSVRLRRNGARTDGPGGGGACQAGGSKDGGRAAGVPRAEGAVPMSCHEPADRRCRSIRERPHPTLVPLPG